MRPLYDFDSCVVRFELSRIVAIGQSALGNQRANVRYSWNRCTFGHSNACGGYAGGPTRLVDSTKAGPLSSHPSSLNALTTMSNPYGQQRDCGRGTSESQYSYYGADGQRFSDYPEPNKVLVAFAHGIHAC